MIRTPADLLPSARETLFMRACLHDGASARDAWERWKGEATADGTPLRRALVPVNALLPLLGWNLRRVGAPIDAALATHLRAAYLTEELRWRKYQDICASAFRTLNDAGIPFVALKGSVIGVLVYPEPLFRHADDIDVLMQDADIERASARLVDAGWKRCPEPPLPHPLHAPPLMHPADVPIELHRRLMVPYYTVPHELLLARSRTAHVAGVDVRVLAESDALMHACARGMSGWPEHRWVVDAWFVLAKSTSFDWQELLATVETSRLGLPMFHALRYLAETLDAPIPRHVIATLASQAAATGYVGRSVAQPWPAAKLGGLPWWQRVPRMWQRAFPPPIRFASRYDVALWAVPFYYVYRLVRYSGGDARRQAD